jgi:Flp pilus assembly protein TadD
MQIGDWAKAESEFAEAIAGEGRPRAEWRASLGYALLREKKYDAAASRFREALQLDSSNEEYKRLLEQSLARKN